MYQGKIIRILYSPGQSGSRAKGGGFVSLPKNIKSNVHPHEMTLGDIVEELIDLSLKGERDGSSRRHILRKRALYHELDNREQNYKRE